MLYRIWLLALVQPIFNHICVDQNQPQGIDSGINMEEKAWIGCKLIMNTCCIMICLYPNSTLLGAVYNGNTNPCCICVTWYSITIGVTNVYAIHYHLEMCRLPAVCEKGNCKLIHPTDRAYKFTGARVITIANTDNFCIKYNPLSSCAVRPWSAWPGIEHNWNKYQGEKDVVLFFNLYFFNEEAMSIRLKGCFTSNHYRFKFERTNRFTWNNFFYMWVYQ